MITYFSMATTIIEIRRRWIDLENHWEFDASEKHEAVFVCTHVIRGMSGASTSGHFAIRRKVAFLMQLRQSERTEPVREPTASASLSDTLSEDKSFLRNDLLHWTSTGWRVLSINLRFPQLSPHLNAEVSITAWLPRRLIYCLRNPIWKKELRSCSLRVSGRILDKDGCRWKTLNRCEEGV